MVFLGGVSNSRLLVEFGRLGCQQRIIDDDIEVATGAMYA